MPKTSKQQAPNHESLEGFEGHYDELGPYTVGFETYTAEADLAPLFAGLPDDRCQSPHWGVVLKGRLSYTHSGGEEVVEAGEAYYVPPGHTPKIFAGTEVVEFSPTKEFAETLEVVMKNSEAEGG
jgi:hypothetical protein